MPERKRRSVFWLRWSMGVVYLSTVKLVAQVKLLVDVAQKTRLLATMERVNAACDWLAERAFELKSADKLRLQRLYYRELRERFGLSAQHAVRAISKVCEVYKRDRAKLPRFKPHGAIPYDQRLYTFKHGLDRVSLLALDGRIVVPCAVGEYHRSRLEGARGQADLVYRKGKLYLYVTVEVPDGSPIKATDVLGVDLGIRNLATDSDGERYSGDEVEATRVRLQARRATLQQVGTRSAHRKLQRLGRREATFRKIFNHSIAKRIVTKARDTGRAIALEDLKGIRDRVTVRMGQRAIHGAWAFHQLRAFLTYKATRAGIPLVLVDPRNTSRTCPECRYCDRANRRSQSEFCCKSCGFSAHADVVGAVNIAHKGRVDRPTVRIVEAGNEDSHSAPRRDHAQSLAL
jgi:putative transposase